MDAENIMPAGAMPPEPPPEEPAVEPEAEKLLGKFNGVDDLATAYKELESKIGQQGSELGSMKQMNAMLLEQMQQAKAQAETPATEDEKDDFDYQTQMPELQKAVSEGDIPIEEALARSANLAAESATRSAMSKYQEMTAKQSQQNAQQRFIDENPDFLEMQRSGALEPIKKSLPGLHDDFSAFYAFKAQQAAEAAQKQADIDRISKGDERAAKVLQSPGGPKSKNIGKPAAKLSQADLKAKTLAELEALG